MDLVRAELRNTGSRSTIHRYLKEIEAEQPAATRPAISDALQDSSTVGRTVAPRS
ncbi:MAG: DNA-binding protein [Xanthomonadales bacterium]|nr:DNA-binding protein [Xanthomonadales bacterium]